jgi:hypothetical protein
MIIFYTTKVGCSAGRVYAFNHKNRPRSGRKDMILIRFFVDNRHLMTLSRRIALTS